MYNAYRTTQDDQHSGTTPLHKDLSDAVNIMTYAASLPNGRPGFARWHIFDENDSQGIREFLQEYYGLSENDGDPIHAQRFYLTPLMLTTLNERGITPHTIDQYPGYAVFIPAGCAHQVKCFAKLYIN